MLREELLLDYSLLVELLKFAKKDYNRICLILNDILKIYERNNNLIKHVLFKDFSFIDINAKILFNKYVDFFYIFDEEKASEFLANLNNYISLMFYIINRIGFKNDLNSRNEYFEQIINNLNEISNLDIDKVYLNLCHGFDNKKIELCYQPEGFIKDECGCRVFYREENIYSDVCPQDEYKTGDEKVSLNFTNPKFVIICKRIIGFSLEKSGNFDSKERTMIIYDLNFSALDLPSRDDLDNTMCGLESYKSLIYDKKRNLFENKMYECTKILNLLHKNLYDLNNLADDLEIKVALKRAFESDFCEFDDDDFVILKTALCNQIDDFMDRRARTLVKKKR